MIRIAIPALATLIAFYLYLRRPNAYIGFTMWTWFLVPLVRRLVDWKFGWTEPNFVLLAPFFVASVSALTLLLPSRRRSLSVPPTFILCGLAIVYGFAMSLAGKPSAEAVYALLNWLAPLLFALHLVLNAEEYPRIRRCVELNFTVGVGVMGVYGVYQFFTAPAWDTYWLENISQGLIDPSFGQPVPFGIRVWSTLNAPGPFANVIMAGLLLLFVTRVRFKLLASVFGYMAFLLSVVRTSWLAYLVGLVLILRGEGPKRIAHVLGALCLLVLLLAPVLQNPEIAPVLGDRIKTFSRLGQDESLRERTDMYRVVSEIIRDEPFGHGLRNQEIDRNLVVDSGILILFLQLGWVGAVLYIAGVLIFFFTPIAAGSIVVARATGIVVEPQEDRLPAAMKSICIAYCAQLVGGQVFVGVTGAIFWMSLGLATAAGRWRKSLTASVA
jgi:hypothetical protein